jgi:hypothetical protein
VARIGLCALLFLALLRAEKVARTEGAAATLVGVIATAPKSIAGKSQTVSADNDSDGLDDVMEDRLAEQFAPIVYHGEDESSYPVSVDWWLERTSLGTMDLTLRRNRTRRHVAGPLRQPQLLGHVALLDGMWVSSSGTRSRGKRVSFFLESLSRTARRREIRPSDWVTYVHSYPNEAGGVTLQYWRAYAWNDAKLAGIDIGHGGDWEAVAVHLDARLLPVKTTYLDHTGIVNWSQSVEWQETHPLVWSEEGGHSSYPDSGHSRSRRFIRQQTWTGGIVTRADDTPIGTSGGLINVGEKSRPRNGQLFVQFSGLWGSPGKLFMTTGYWGPAFNETDAQCADGSPAYQPYLRRASDSPRCGRIYLKAWCDGMDGNRLNRQIECYASSDTS